MPDRSTTLRSAMAIVAVAALSLLFIASYAGALHEPTPHEVPIAVTAKVPASVTATLDSSSQLAVEEVGTTADALASIDHRDVYGAIGVNRRGLVVFDAPAASAAISDYLRGSFALELRQASKEPVAVRTVHPLPDTDTRGLVGFYTVIGWAIAGYLGATLFGLTFGTSPSRRRTAWRLGALSILGLLVGLGGAGIATAIAGYDHGFAKIAAIGLLTVLATGSITIALQALLGILGTGLAILLFVVFGNPAAGGPYAGELLPGIWRAAGQLIPTGAATSAVRNAAYFPDASIAGPTLVLAIWILVGAGVALAVGRRRGLGEDEAKASLAGIG
jgi:hypothetical protein